MIQQAIAIIRPKKPLVSANADSLFWIHEGPSVKNLKELTSALKRLTNAQFAHHVNAGKNDFSNWIQEVLRDRDLAGKLRQCKTRLGTVRAIEAHLQKNYAI
ncbi:MAG: hypothetical protein HY564_02225 [Candidatus Jacksonbacteria bacterium]|nr:hypothetical protein [Candidatus Jacksonbacteria bacterium]